ncbi:maturation protein [ssRNA phage SRR6254351_1]|uniref:Maturation protein n=1 Tax=ssRNA phage SRR6254351_1 TaxID=2786492 RepID=A0A8S5L5I7_9VIRU|nr:maturation protein [ssRNA phage SRR6254351_1]DAD52538.1 TPA_asm: maturation protein [ssRNA phage SRR6254351_1]
MPRDVRRTTKTVRVERVVATTGKVQSYNDYPLVVIDRARADSIPTTPSGGSYSDPTSYWGRFFSCTSLPFSYRTQASSPAFERIVRGETAIQQLSVVLDPGEVYGCYEGSKLPDLGLEYHNLLDSALRQQVLSNNWNAGQTIGELNETLDFIKAAAEVLYRMAKAARRGDFLSLGQLARSANDPGVTVDSDDSQVLYRGRLKRFYRHERGVITNSQLNRARRRARKQPFAKVWLAYQFGWLPLLSDIYSAIELATDGLRGSTSFTASAAFPVLPLGRPPVRSGTILVGMAWDSRREIKGELRYRVSNPDVFSLTQLGLTNPLSLSWELLPLSFVVDWFVPVGRFLDSLQRPIGLTFDHGYKTSWSWWKLDAIYKFDVNIKSGSLPRLQASGESFNRELYLTFPMPAPYFRGFETFTRNTRQGLEKTISGLALILR